jgi:hypothetical protein
MVMCAFLWILSPYANVAGLLIYGKPFKNRMDIDERETLTALGPKIYDELHAPLDNIDWNDGLEELIA